MKVIGFNFTKINVERFKESYESDKLEIKTSIDISEIKDVKSDFLKIKDHVLKIDFKFTVNYEPKVAEIELKGRFFFSIETKLAKEILKQWKKKKIPEEFRHILFNIILKKSTLRALSLEEEINLPSHIPLPSFKRKE